MRIESKVDTGTFWTKNPRTDSDGLTKSNAIEGEKKVRDQNHHLYSEPKFAWPPENSSRSPTQLAQCQALCREIYNGLKIKHLDKIVQSEHKGR